MTNTNNKLQNHLWNELNGMCPYCRVKMIKSWTLFTWLHLTKAEKRRFMEIDHIDNNHGNNSLDNLVGCCKLCNIRKRNKILGIDKAQILHPNTEVYFI